MTFFALPSQSLGRQVDWPNRGPPIDILHKNCKDILSGDHVRVARTENNSSLNVVFVKRVVVTNDRAVPHHDAPVEGWMKVLFKERSWGEMAASETQAHLEHLRVTDEAEARTDDDGLVRFTLVNS